MRPDTVADSIGVVLLTTLAALPISCVPSLPMVAKPDLQPLVATAGAYSVMAGEAPAPVPVPVPPAGCEEGCKCNGTGKEMSGDGLAIVGCRCADNCPCKQPKRAAVPTQGVPGWPPRNLDR